MKHQSRYFTPSSDLYGCELLDILVDRRQFNSPVFGPGNCGELRISYEIRTCQNYRYLAILTSIHNNIFYADIIFWVSVQTNPIFLGIYPTWAAGEPRLELEI
jgi:hypothetical protein